jgi:hypothetical protein
VIVEALSNSIRDYFINCCSKQQSYFVLPISPTRTVAIIKKAGNPQQFQIKTYTKQDMAEKVTEA